MTVGEGADKSIGAVCMRIGNHDNPLSDHHQAPSY